MGTARVSASTRRSASGAPAAISRSMSVSVGPGQTTLAVTPARANSRAIVLVKAITAALAPAYTASWAEPTRAASELRLTIRPQPRCAIAPMTACVVRRQPS